MVVVVKGDDGPRDVLLLLLLLDRFKKAVGGGVVNAEEDFIDRVDKAINNKVLRNMITTGVFDALLIYLLL